MALAGPRRKQEVCLAWGDRRGEWRFESANGETGNLLRNMGPDTITMAMRDDRQMVGQAGFATPQASCQRLWRLHCARSQMPAPFQHGFCYLPGSGRVV